MNERMQELADEAEDYADNIVDQGGEFHQTYTKKISELIITDIISRMYRYEMPERKTEKLIQEICQVYGIVE